MEKKILIESGENQALLSAIEAQQSEKMDILNFVIGGIARATGGAASSNPAICNTSPDFLAFADSTYVKK